MHPDLSLFFTFFCLPFDSFWQFLSMFPFCCIPVITFRDSTSPVWSGSVVVTAYDFEPGHPGSNPEWGQYTMRLRSLHRAYPSLHPSGVIHWVPEQLNMKAVTEAYKLIDSCSLELCSATPSVASSGICHRNKVNPIAWLYRDDLVMR